jgi:hypothetical protein
MLDAVSKLENRRAGWVTAPALSAYYGSHQLRSHVRYLPDPRRRV